MIWYNQHRTTRMSIDVFLSRLESELAPIRTVALRYLGPDGIVSDEEGSLRLSYRPRIGSEAYAVTLFAGLSDPQLTQFERTFQAPIPNTYRSILRRLNGAYLFRLSLFGVPLSML